MPSILTSNEAQSSCNIEMTSQLAHQQGSRTIRPEIDIPTKMLTGSTMVESPTTQSRGFSLLSNDNPTAIEEEECVGAILQEFGEQLVCTTPRAVANKRYTQPAGRRRPSEEPCPMSTNTAINGFGTGVNPIPSKPLFRHRSSTKSHSLYKSNIVDHPFISKGWKNYLHPDGKHLFIHEDMTEGVTFSTDVWIYQSHRLDEVELWRKNIWRLIAAARAANECPARLEVYIGVDGKDERCSYYMIDQVNHSMFWEHDGCPADEWEEDLSGAALDHQLYTEFWVHTLLFPHSVPPDAEEKLRVMLNYNIFDALTSPGTTSAYSKQEASECLQTLDNLSKLPSEAITKNHIIARMCKVYYYNRYLTCYGEEGARLDRTQPSIDPPNDVTAFGVWVGLLVFRATVFGMDNRQFEKIQEVIVDDVVLAQAWRTFLEGFVRTIEQSNIMATVILAANTSFLSISTITKAEATASLISTLFSFSSLLIGLLYSRQHGALLNTHGYVAATYFQKTEYPSLGGYRLLAIFLCLPSALLIWSILTFFLAIGLLAYQMLGEVYGWFFLATALIQILIIPVTILFFWRKWEPTGGFPSLENCFSLRPKDEEVKAEMIGPPPEAIFITIPSPTYVGSMAWKSPYAA